MLLVKLIEPPLAEPHERWCERSVGDIIAYLLLDCCMIFAGKWVK